MTAPQNIAELEARLSEPSPAAIDAISNLDGDIMLLGGIVSGISFAMLFAAGMIPGIILAVLFMLVIWVVVRLDPDRAPVGDRMEAHAVFDVFYTSKYDASATFDPALVQDDYTKLNLRLGLGEQAPRLRR